MAKEKYDFGSYMVGLLDVQGQHEKFRMLKVPITDAEAQAVNEVILETAGFVDSLRDQLRGDLREFEERVSRSWGFRESLQPKFTAFSDSLVVSIPLWNASDLAKITKIYSILSAASNAMMTCFSKGHALRGGIEIGLASELESGEVYGTALLEAYRLESCEAQYPRIVIGDELWKFLSIGVSECESRKVPELEKICDLIKKSVAFTSPDTDGRRVLDYLGDFVKTIALPGTASNFIEPAYKFVVAEHEKWIANGDAKLGPRYAQLREYFESRLPLWELPISLA
jgi:hypothetical protein